MLLKISERIYVDLELIMAVKISENGEEPYKHAQIVLKGKTKSLMLDNAIDINAFVHEYNRYLINNPVLPMAQLTNRIYLDVATVDCASVHEDEQQQPDGIYLSFQSKSESLWIRNKEDVAACISSLNNFCINNLPDKELELSPPDLNFFRRK